MSTRDVFELILGLTLSLAAVAGVLWKGSWWAVFTILESPEGRKRLAGLLKTIETEKPVTSAENVRNEQMSVIVRDSPIARLGREPSKSDVESIAGTVGEFVGSIVREANPRPKQKRKRTTRGPDGER